MGYWCNKSFQADAEGKMYQNHKQNPENTMSISERRASQLFISVCVRKHGERIKATRSDMHSKRYTRACNGQRLIEIEYEQEKLLWCTRGNRTVKLTRRQRTVQGSQQVLCNTILYGNRRVYEIIHPRFPEQNTEHHIKRSISKSETKLARLTVMADKPATEKCRSNTKKIYRTGLKQ